MSQSASARDEFEEQIRQEKIVQETASDEDIIGKARTRVDEDGTVFEWDGDKKAWFPKIDDDFIAKYQMSYGAGTETNQEAPTTAETSSTTATPTPANMPSPSDPNYAQWYYYYYGDGSGANTMDTTTEAYKKWYDYYYGSKTDGETDQADGEKAEGEEAPKEGQTDASNEDLSGKSKEEQEAYWKEYYEYYKSQGMEAPDPSSIPQSDAPTEAKADDKATEKGKKGEKRKAEPPAWFEVQDDKNTNVYVHGLPPDTTDDEYREIMNKCGLIMFDPRTRNLKLKLYRKPNGELKGDGLCCYIKPESVDLALQILDGSEVRGYKLHVEKAKFELKGSFDASKRKKKLSNREKKKFQEKQSKLFDWRPDKVAQGGRPRNERVVIIKHAFDPEEFDKDPKLINELRTDLRQECSKYGEVKKVMVYDRNREGTVGVTFSEPDEADVCLEAVHGRWFAQRQLTAETWDGKTRYDIAESEEERQKRLKQWEEYLEGKDPTDSKKEEKVEVTEGKEAESKGGEMETGAKTPEVVEEEMEEEEEEEEEEEPKKIEEEAEKLQEDSTPTAEDKGNSST